MPNWKKVIVSGSDATLTSVIATAGFTGSLQGTASYSTQALSASYAPSTFPYTGSAQITGSLTIVGATTTTQLGIGAAPSGSVPLDVRAQGTLSTDIAFRVRNSSNTGNLASINGNGTINLGNSNFDFQSTEISGRIAIVGSSNTGTTYNAYSIISILGHNNSLASYGHTSYIGLNSTLNQNSGGTITGMGESNILSGGVIGVGMNNNIQNTNGNSAMNIGIGYNNSVHYEKSNTFLIGNNLRANSAGSVSMVKIGNSNSIGTLAQIDKSFEIYLNGQIGSDFHVTGKTNIVLKNNSVLVSGTSYEAAATNTLTTHNGVAPTTNITAAFQMYSSASSSGNAKPYFRTENGTVIYLGDQSKLYNVTASSIVSSFTGSLFGTASFAITAQTASYVLNAVSSSFAQTASYATNAVTASYAPPTFPYTGSAEITGSLGITGSLNNGIGNIAGGPYSHAEGAGTTANGYASHAEGNSTQANGYASHTEGDSTTANGPYSHAEGNSAQANGPYSHAEGEANIANGDSSHAEGANTIAGQFGYGASPAITAGVYELDGGYGNLTALFSPGTFVVIDDFLGQINGTPNIFKLEVASSTFNATPATEITLVDTTINTGNNKYTTGISGTNNPTLADISIGFYSHTSGDATHTIGKGSTTEGIHTEALGYYQSVVGMYNESITDYGAFIIGGGYDSTPRNLLVASPLNQIVTVSGSTTTYKSLTTQTNISVTFTVSGEIVEAITIDGAVSLYDLISLDNGGTWKQTNQTTALSEKLLGIYIGNAKVLLSGYLTVCDLGSVGPLVAGSLQEGLVVYIQQSASGAMSVNIPGGLYIRTLGHILYHNASSANNWTMKFNPSNDWV